MKMGSNGDIAPRKYLARIAQASEDLVGIQFAAI